MCKAIEEIRSEAAKEAAKLNSIQVAIKLLNRGKESFEEIAEDSGLTPEEVHELSEQLHNVTA